MPTDFVLTPTRYQLRVLSAVAANFTVAWLGASFVTRDSIGLLVNLLFGMFSLLAAMLLERGVEYYDS